MKLFAAALLTVWHLNATALFFEGDGSATFVARPAMFDQTYTGSDDGSWILTDNSSPCFPYDPKGCNLGTFTFRPPRVNLPPGTEIAGAFFEWGLSVEVPAIRPNRDLVTLVVTTPSRTYSVLLNPGLVEYGGVEPYGDAVRTALLSDGQARPVTVDVLFLTSGPFIPIGPAPPGSVLTFQYSYALDGIGRTPTLRFDYEILAVPEPSTTAPAALGMWLILLLRLITWRAPV